MQLVCDNYNNRRGTYTGYDCPVCKNKGDISVVVNDAIESLVCKCMEHRRNMARIENSGLKDLMGTYTFERYTTANPWQAGTKAKAMRYVTGHDGKWFYIGGQVGCGKTHLCTAIVAAFLNAGFPARYMLWRDEVVPLKAMVTDDAAYADAINKLKTVKVLYIDDFFKTERGRAPTTADINIAFELLNYRYNNSDLITIISSEKTVDELIAIDEATGSRVYQRSKDFCINIGTDRTKNFRLNPVEDNG